MPLEKENGARKREKQTILIAKIALSGQRQSWFYFSVINSEPAYLLPHTPKKTKAKQDSHNL